MKLVAVQNRVAQTSGWLRVAFIAVLCIMASCGAPAAHAFTAADADTLLAAHTKAFYHEQGNQAWFAKSTDGGKADFWMWAEQMEMLLDAYERTHNTQQLTMFNHLFHGFVAEHGANWARNPYNDDIMWMVIACARANLLTGNAVYRDAARTNFDLCYARAASADLGGGLWWKTDNKSKNACVNGPGAIAAVLLGRVTGDAAYVTKAKSLFLWEKATLFDATTGRVADNIDAGGKVARFALTYNQGTFVGAANLLGYTQEARLAALYTMNQLCHDGYLPASGEDNDGGGFNGIGVRWIARFMQDHNEQATFEPWLQKNAEAAWQARRPSDNLSWCRWPQPTPEGKRYSWGCSNAIVITQLARPTEPAKPQPAALVPAALTTLAPLPATAPAATEINAFLKADQKQMPPTGAVLFMGSSSIRMWDTKADFPEIPVINRGFGGSQIFENTLYVDRIATPYKPKIIVFCAGTNDLAYGNKNSQQVFQEYQEFVAKVHAALPDTRIVYISMNPTVARWKLEAETLEANHLIEKWIFEHNSPTEKLNFINSHAVLLTADGQPPADLLRADKLHFNAKGYQAWTAIVKPRVLALAAMDGVTRLDAPAKPQ